MDEIVEKIKRKMQSGNIPLSFLEKKYIEINKELKEEYIKKLSMPGYIWSKDELRFVYNSNIVDYEVLNDQLLYNFLLAVISYNPNDALEFYNGLNDITNNISYFDKLKEKIDLIDKNSAEEEYSNGILENLLDNKEYERIYKLKSNNRFNIPVPLLERFLNEFPFEQYGFPPSFSLCNNAHICLSKIDYMDLNTLLNTYDTIQINRSKIDDIAEPILLIEEKVKERLGQGHISKEAIYRFTDVGYFSFINQSQIIEFLDKKDIFFLNQKVSLKKEELTPEKIHEICIKMKNNEFTYYSIKTSFEKGYTDGFENREILDYLLERGDVLTLSKISDENLKSEYLNKVISSLNNPLIIENLKKNPKVILESNDLYLAVLNANILKRYPLTVEVSEDPRLYNAIINYCSKNGDIQLYKEINGYTENSLDFYSLLLFTKNYDEFLNRNYYEEDTLSPELIELIKKEIKSSDEFAYKMAQRVLNSYEGNNDIIKSIMARGDICSYVILDQINHEEEYKSYYNEEIYNLIKGFVSSFYKYDTVKLDYITNKFGYEILKYLDNENIKMLLSFSIENIEKIATLIEKREYTFEDLKAGYDTIKQYEYFKNNPDIVQIFTNILHSIDDNNDLFLENIKKLSQVVIDDKLYERLNKTYGVAENIKGNLYEYLLFITNKIKSKDENYQKYIDILHEISNCYIQNRRDDYTTTYNIGEELNLPYRLNQKEELDFLLSLVIKQNYQLSNGFQFLDILKQRCMSYGINESMVLDAINFINDPKTAQFTNDRSKVMKKMKFIKDTAQEIIITNKMHLIDNPDIKKEIDAAVESGKISKEYYVEEREVSYYSLLTSLRLDIIKDKLLSNPEVYESLLKFIDKRKIQFIPSKLEEFINEHTEMRYTPDSIASIINYYYKIHERELSLQEKPGDERMLSLISAIKNAEVYSSVSSVYTQVLGLEDARLIAANGGPNMATKKTKTDERLKEALDWTIRNFERQKNTIPSFNETITINDKSLRCVVGNFTHPSNLTHGERTGACMRIGGAGETLFQFALENKNGFHIRFENPKNGKYVSRVTGFRNGNTVFLNELRNSYDSEYSDEELVEFCKELSKEIISRSLDSSMPIDNVVVHRAYATTNMLEQEQNLKVDSIKEGLPAFYTDVNSHAIVLATSNPDNSLVPVNFNKTSVPEYMPSREKITELTPENLEKNSSMINRVHAINAYLKTRSYDNIGYIEFETGFVYGFANQDWYIYVDNDLNIKGEMINMDSRAKIEFDEAMSNVMRMIEENKKIERSDSYAL